MCVCVSMCFFFIRHNSLFNVYANRIRLLFWIWFRSEPMFVYAQKGEEKNPHIHSLSSIANWSLISDFQCFELNNAVAWWKYFRYISSLLNKRKKKAGRIEWLFHSFAFLIIRNLRRSLKLMYQNQLTARRVLCFSLAELSSWFTFFYLYS